MYCNPTVLLWQFLIIELVFMQEFCYTLISDRVADTCGPATGEELASLLLFFYLRGNC